MFSMPYFYSELIWLSNEAQILVKYCYSPGLSNLRPMGRMQPMRQYCAARKVMYILIVLGDLMK